MSNSQRAELEKVIFEEWTVEGRQETIEPKTDEKEMAKRAQMKKNMNLLHQLDNSGVTVIRNSSGILRDTSNDYNKATHLSMAHHVGQKPSYFNGKSDSIIQLERQLIE